VRSTEATSLLTSYGFSLPEEKQSSGERTK
jgi:hypothetical protein